MGKHRLWAPGEEIFFLAWSFPNCFLALSVILVEKFQLPDPNPNPQPWKHWVFWAGVHIALEGVHLPSVKFVPDNLEHWNLKSWQPISYSTKYENLETALGKKWHYYHGKPSCLVDQTHWIIISFLFKVSLIDQTAWFTRLRCYQKLWQHSDLKETKQIIQLSFERCEKFSHTKGVWVWLRMHSFGRFFLKETKHII